MHISKICLLLSSLIPVYCVSAELISDINLPDGFESHFFGSPIIVRVNIDGRLLGDGEVILTKDNTIRLVSITGSDESQFDLLDQQLWLKRLDKPYKLNSCGEDCPENVISLHYSMEESSLSILTTKAEFHPHDQRYLSVPRDSSGLILTNQLNLAKTDQRSGRYNLQLEGSIGQWSPYMEGDATWQDEGGGQVGLAQLYNERLVDDKFYRLGFFFPSSQGLVRQPNYFNGATTTVLGLMWGSSDLLRRDVGVASMTPIQVTPTRNGVVEIYRNGSLLLTQPVSPGLQALDTRMLPGGIYEIELRLMEDGQETRRWRETVYKPNNWQTPDEPWRFNMFAGRQTRWLVRSGDSQLEGMSAGLAVNRLLLPNVIIGAGSQYVDQKAQQSLSLDWGMTDQLQTFTSLNQAAELGWSYDVQAVYGMGSRSIVASHSQALTKKTEQRSLSTISLRQSFERWGSLGLYFSHQSGVGNGINLGWNYSDEIWGRWVTWGTTLFNRPSVNVLEGNQRDQGVLLNMSINFGDIGEYRQLTMGLGSNNSSAEEASTNGYIDYQQRVDWGPLNQVGMGTVFDHHGVGLTGRGGFDANWLNGDLFVQQSTFDHKVTGGLNASSVIALSQEAIAVGTTPQVYDDAVIILDIEAENSEASILLSDERGGVKRLSPGRHIVPVPSFSRGSLNLEMGDYENMPLTIYPSSIPYSLNRGGVSYHKVKAVQTVTIIGRLLDGNGAPLKGAMVSNGLNRAFTEIDGFFTLDAVRSDPTFEVDLNGFLSCKNELTGSGDKEMLSQVINLGDYKCSTARVANN
ncbi:TcfC E-set like domain-containing protein [Aeromonas dhakensis]|uniref:TcfC E-set like domain-containing protein n=1 Tax=Aeromonas dhakensis TaxID=196024 RepID=UPI0039871F9A